MSALCRKAVIPIEKTNRKAPLLLYTVLCVIIAIELTVYLSSVLYARFTSGDAVAQGARVARFSIESDLLDYSDQLSLSLKPGEEEQYVFMITNNSEVKVAYISEFTPMFNNLPLEFLIESADGNNFIEIGATETVTVTVRWKGGTEHASTEYAGKSEVIRWSFTVSQVD